MRGFLRLVVSGVLGSVLLSGCASVSSFRDRPRDPESLLRYLHADMQFAFSQIESDLDGTARMLERTGPSGGAARELLEGLSLRHAAISTAFSARSDGAVVASEPIPHRQTESQSDDFEARVMSALGGAPGLHAAGDSHVLWKPIPAFREFDEARVGVLVSLSATFDMIRSAPRIGEPVDVWMVDPNGVIVADADGREVGRSLLSDSTYASHTEMLNVAAMIAEQRRGRVQYTYFGPDFIVVKEAGWETVRLGGKEWRLVVEHVAEGNPENVLRIAEPFTPMTYQQVISNIAIDSRVRSAAADARPSQVLAVLREYYERYPGLYNVQWMDANGITQVGYPIGRSLDAYDHRSGLRPGDEWLLGVLNAQEMHSESGRLADGNVGEMYVAPVRNGVMSLGMIYAVRPTAGM